jgi:hypothetical protein
VVRTLVRFFAKIYLAPIDCCVIRFEPSKLWK